MMSKPQLKLSSEPDAYGFYYGDVTNGDEIHQVPSIEGER